MNLIQRAFNTIREGETGRDKIVIILYYAMLPVRKLINKNTGNLPNDVIILNKHGKYSVSSIGDANLVCSKFDRNIIKWIDLKEGTVVDIGAHVGKHSIRLARKLKNNGHVIAIEPHPTNYAKLKQNMKLNRIKNMTLVRKGCFNKKMEGKIFNGKEDLAASSVIEKNTGHDGTFHKIPLDTLDNIVKDLKLKRLDLLKIDVEGVDLEVIEGGIETIKKFKPKIIIEISGYDYSKRIFEILGSVKLINGQSIYSTKSLKD